MNVHAVLLACFLTADVLFALLLWRFLRLRNRLGELLFEAPPPRSWPNLLWLGIGVLTFADALYHGPGLDARDPMNHAVDYVFGGTLIAAALFSLWLKRGLRVYERGLIHSFLVLRWEDLRTWAWEREELLLWIRSPWRWYVTRSSKSPTRTGAAYHDELDGLLQHYAPAATATRT